MTIDETLRERQPLREYLLGGFVTAMLFYLPVANVLKLIPLEKPPERGESRELLDLHGRVIADDRLQALFLGVSSLCDRVGDITGVPQGWSLFAPSFPPQSHFPLMTLEWPDRPSVILTSEFEPADLDRPFRWPPLRHRRFNYDNRMVLGMAYWTADSYREHTEAWRNGLKDRVVRTRRSLQAWLRWNMTQYLRTHEGTPTPTAVVLSVKLIPPRPIEPPDAPRPPVTIIPFVRWRPAQPAVAGHTEIEWFDLDAKQFVTLPIEGEP